MTFACFCMTRGRQHSECKHSSNEAFAREKSTMPADSREHSLATLTAILDFWQGIDAASDGCKSVKRKNYNARGCGTCSKQCPRVWNLHISVIKFTVKKQI